MNQENYDSGNNDKKKKTDDAFRDSFGNKSDDETQNKQDNSGEDKSEREEEINDNELKAAENRLNNLKDKINKSERVKRLIKELEEKIKRYKEKQEKFRKERENKQKQSNKNNNTNSQSSEGNSSQTEQNKKHFKEGADTGKKTEKENQKNNEEKNSNESKKDKTEEKNKSEKGGSNSSEKSQTESKSQEKENDKEKNAEKLKEEAEQAFQELLEGDSSLREIKKKRGKFKKTLAILGIGKKEEAGIKKELEDQEKIVEELKEKYEAKFNEFSQELVKERERELKSEGKNENEIDDLIRKFAFDDKVISVDKKAENGQIEKEKVSLMEYFNRNQEKLLDNREGILSEKQRAILKKIGENYSSLSKTQKIVLGVGLSATAGATVALAGGAAISAALGYGAWRGGKTLLRRATVGALSGVAIKGMNTGLTKRAEKKNIADLEKAKGEFTSGFKDGQFNLYDVLNKQNLKERKRNRNKKIAVGVTAGALFGTVIGVEGFMAGDADATIPDDDSLKGVPDRTNGGSIADKINEDKTGSGIEKDQKLAGSEKYFTEEGKLSEKNFRETQTKAGNEFHENYDKEKITEALKLNSHFELAKGGNVWNSLSEHFNGDKQEIGKVLAGFRAETMDDLMKNHGMSEVRANQFIEWRYRHMNIGTAFELKNGKLEIPDFDSDQKIAQFGKTEFNSSDSMNDTMENAEKSRVKRFNEMAAKKTVNIQEPMDMDKALDPKISAQINQNINNLVKDIYGRQAYEWDVMKNKNALDVMNGEFGNPIKAIYGEGIGERVGAEVNEVIESERGAINNSDLDQAEINNRKELRGILTSLVEQTGIKPEPNETVEQFIRSVEEAQYNQGIGENIPEDTTVKVSDPDSFENSGNEVASKNDLTGAPDRLVSWENLKNAESWEILNRGDELTRNHLKDLIVNSNLIPGEGESLEEFHNRALEKINGTARVPQTGLEESLNKVFGEWDRNKIDQWLKMREYKAEVIYDKNLLDLNLTDQEQMAFSSMKAHLGELARVSGVDPSSGESLSEYIEKTQKSLKV
jgi:hypothetical protein